MVPTALAPLRAGASASTDLSPPSWHPSRLPCNHTEEITPITTTGKARSHLSIVNNTPWKHYRTPPPSPRSRPTHRQHLHAHQPIQFNPSHHQTSDRRTYAYPILAPRALHRSRGPRARTLPSTLTSPGFFSTPPPDRAPPAALSPAPRTPLRPTTPRLSPTLS